LDFLIPTHALECVVFESGHSRIAWPSSDPELKGLMSVMAILRQLSNARRLFSIFQTIWGGEWQDQ
jgi:hypothetical protein